MLPRGCPIIFLISDPFLQVQQLVSPEQEFVIDLQTLHYLHYTIS